MILPITLLLLPNLILLVAVESAEDVNDNILVSSIVQYLKEF